MKFRALQYASVITLMAAGVLSTSQALAGSDSVSFTVAQPNITAKDSTLAPLNCTSTDGKTTVCNVAVDSGPGAYTGVFLYSNAGTLCTANEGDTDKYGNLRIIDGAGQVVTADNSGTCTISNPTPGPGPGPQPTPTPKPAPQPAPAAGKDDTKIIISVGKGETFTPSAITYTDPTVDTLYISTTNPFTIPAIGDNDKLGINIFSDTAGAHELKCDPDNAVNPAVDKYGMLDVVAAKDATVNVSMSDENKKDSAGNELYVCSLSGSGHGAMQISTPQNYVTDGQVSAAANPNPVTGAKVAPSYIVPFGDILFTYGVDQASQGLSDFNVTPNTGGDTGNANELANWTAALQSQGGASKGIFAYDVDGPAQAKARMLFLDEVSANKFVNNVINPIVAVDDAAVQHGKSPLWQGVGFDLEGMPPAPEMWKKLSAVAVANGLPVGNFAFGVQYTYTSIQSNGPMGLDFASTYDIGGQRTDAWGKNDYTCTVHDNHGDLVASWCPESAVDSFNELNNEMNSSTAVFNDNFDSSISYKNVLDLWSQTHFHTIWALPMSGTALNNSGFTIGYANGSSDDGTKTLTASDSASNYSSADAKQALQYWSSVASVPMTCNFQVPAGSPHSCYDAVNKFLSSNAATKCTGYNHACTIGDFIKHELPKPLKASDVINLCTTKKGDVGLANPYLCNMKNTDGSNKYSFIMVPLTEDYSGVYGVIHDNNTAPGSTSLTSFVDQNTGFDPSYKNDVGMSLLAIAGEIDGWQSAGLSKDVTIADSFYALQARAYGGEPTRGIYKDQAPFYTGTTKVFTDSTQSAVNAKGQYVQKLSQGLQDDAAYADLKKNIWSMISGAATIRSSQQ
jgi:hypothetical protein